MKNPFLNAAMLALAVSLGTPALAELKGMDMQVQSEPHDRIEVTGQVDKIMADKNRIVLAHEPIPALGWPAMTMGFEVAEDVGLEALRPGDAVRFMIAPQDGKNKIVEIEKTQ